MLSMALAAQSNFKVKTAETSLGINLLSIFLVDHIILD